jgi:uncharacterized protein (DUF697 family)
MATSTKKATTKTPTEKEPSAPAASQREVAAARTEEANAIVRKYALFGTATALIPVFGVDVAALTAVQTKMVNDLAEVYGYDISDQLMQTALTNGITSLASRVITGMLTGIAKSFTPLKSLVGGALSAAFAGFITAETGKIYQARMEAGQHPADIKVSDIIDHIILQLREGKFNPTNVKGQFAYLLNQ